MLYLMESGLYAKIGYTTDYSTLKNRFNTYQTHNPTLRLVDIAEGTKEDEKRLQALYKDYILSNSEWCYTKKLVTKIWIIYRASREQVDYYTEFGINANNIIEDKRVILDSNFIKAIKAELTDEKEIDLYNEFKNYYNE